MKFVICFVPIYLLLSISFIRIADSSEMDVNFETPNLIQQVDPENLRQTILHLQSYGERMSHEKQWDTAYWIKDQFKNSGLKTNIHQYEYKGKNWPNVIGTIKGKEASLPAIMLIAHLDSIAYNSEKMAPGADDNGSGVAVILETARILNDILKKRKAYFCIFSNEEMGAKGSNAFVKLVKKQGIKIKAVINIDSLAYNRPKKLIFMEAIKFHKSLKGKLRVVFKMIRNYCLGFFYSKDVLTVAGRYPNRNLVNIMTETIRQHSQLKVVINVSEDCG